ncbi:MULTISPECIES: HNH endonuclease [unclassified Janthinobacterium]|uniref:HNH endonuclease n=1 Tax=unclassified Janthinobacterium TaxID=2610881 RepID=UPI000CB1B1ED|nr:MULTISPECIES: HNH endonuclease [unclassified Janthinobacterium]MBW3510595.1 HNH endonuclease [Janthinobacterium sp. NKUCC06_STL]PKB13822.1 hypothetical protein CLU91_5443 [Janthinobacterium sp. 64]
MLPDTYTINTDQVTNPGESLHNRWLERGIAVLSRDEDDLEKLAQPAIGAIVLMWENGIGGVAAGKFSDNDVLRVTRTEDIVSKKEVREFHRKVDWYADLRKNPITATEFSKLHGTDPNGRLRRFNKGKEEILELIETRSRDIEKEQLETRAAKFAEVQVRPDQQAFSKSVFIACEGRCIVSGCKIRQVLDAAHKTGRNWRSGQNSAGDGFMIRKDLHALYDNNLLWFDEDCKVRLATNVYPDYAQYEGVQISPAHCQ